MPTDRTIFHASLVDSILRKESTPVDAPGKWQRIRKRAYAAFTEEQYVSYMVVSCVIQ